VAGVIGALADRRARSDRARRARAAGPSVRERLEARRAEDPWWDDWLAVERPSGGNRKPLGRWGRAVGWATGLHLVLAALFMFERTGDFAVAPGTGSPAIEVVMLPAWPEPGHRKIELGADRVAPPTTHAPPTQSPPQGQPPLMQTAAIDPRLMTLTPAPTAPPDAAARDAPVPVTRTAETATSPRLNAPPSSPSAAEAMWDSQLLDKLASLKRYPAQAERAGQQDTVMVRFIIDRTGTVLSADIAKSRGFASLDGEARALIQRASPLPAPPSEVAGDEIELTAPIQFILHRAP